VAALTMSGAVAVVALRNLPPERILFVGIIALTLGVLITLAGVQFQNVNVMLLGTVVGGTGFGTVFSGTLRLVLAHAQSGERAGLLSAYFVVGYLAFSVPALAAGFLAPVIGLTRTADFYGAGVILLALSTLIVNHLRQRPT
jgi:cyanate permease